MKLSAAILKGCEAHPLQAFGELHIRESGAMCAIGAAVVGETDCEPQDVSCERFSSLWVWMRRSPPKCPECGRYFFEHETEYNVVGHLNDAHKWARERIAAWVATVEPLA